MNADAPAAQPPHPFRRFELDIRVRYHEVDGQRRVHHGQYLNYFERARVEMLRAGGVSYRELENRGLMLVVRSIHVTYHVPAEFDDLLRLSVETLEARRVRVMHRYELRRDGRLMVEAASEIVCLDAAGRVNRLPPELELPDG